MPRSENRLGEGRQTKQLIHQAGRYGRHWRANSRGTDRSLAAGGDCASRTSACVYREVAPRTELVAIEYARCLGRRWRKDQREFWR